MKWYNYGKAWINLERSSRIDLDEPNMEIYFYGGCEGWDWFYRMQFDTREEYKIEASKIKVIMGVDDKDYTSCGC